MAAPTLLIGLGGTGSKIVLRVSQMVTEEQRQHIGFAVFDTDINELRQIREENPFIKTIQTSTKLTVGEYLNIDTHARDNWFPVNRILCSKALTEGAGQVRAISRLAFDTAIRAGYMEPLHQAIEDLYKLESSSDDQALRVIIVSSLAGGTGSGLILPVALYVKNFLATKFQQGANITRGFFILPEVFYEVIRGQTERNNLNCNAYATLREIDAFLMKGDATLPDKFSDTVKLEFPRVGSEDVEEYNVRPYDFCFLFDAQNTEGKKLNDFGRYLDHAANCIYSQSIGPMNKRSNSSEDNTIRELCAQSGRNRYAGAGSSMLIYPFEDVKEYISLKWAQQCVSEQWLEYDRMYKEQKINNQEMRSHGFNVKDPDPSQNYIDTVEQLDKQKNPFARAIVNSCSIFDQTGLAKEGDRWSEYIKELKKFITRDAVSGQRDIDAQRQQAQQLIGEIVGSKEIWEAFQDAYREMIKYKLMVEKRSEDTARTIGYSVFKTKNDSATRDKLKHQLETYLRDAQGKFIHPNAVRYFLYKTFEQLNLEKQAIDRRIRQEENHFLEFDKIFDDPDTDENETIDDLSSRKVAFLNKFGKTTDEQNELKKKFTTYIATVDEYRVNSILSTVLEEGISYVDSLCSAFQTFYTTFELQLENIEKKTALLARKYDHTKGTAARYVCASSVCLEEMLKRMPYTGNTVTIDGELAESIYMRVRNYSMLKEKPKGENFFSDIFKDGIIGYFEDMLMEGYGESVNMDILTALEKEAQYEYGEYDASKIDQFVRNAINDTRKLSNPFIERPLGEQKEPISSCTYSKSLDPKDDSPRSQLIAKELKNYGGEPDSDIPKNMIMFYQSIYGLRANKLSKFAPADKNGRGEGAYYKAYYELISQIKPKSDKTPVITPHIDKNWHIISHMPDLDDENQKAQETKIYKAFILGFVFDLIRFAKTSGKKCYKLYLKSCDPESFVVSNQTECDNFYEVLDALTINPVIVKNIVDAAERRLLKERSGSGKIDFEKSLLKSLIGNLECAEFGLKELSVFDLCALLKVSTPGAEFCTKTGLDLVNVILDFIFDYVRSIVPDAEADNVFGGYISEQFDKFYANLPWYRSNNDESVLEFIDDASRAIADNLEDKGLDELCEAIKLKAKRANAE